MPCTPIKNVALFVGGTLLTLLYLDRVAPDPNTFWNRQFRPHLEQLIEAERERTDDAYLIAFGSSLTCYNFVPSAFESALAELGSPLRVYNLGVAGANGHEVNYYLRRTLAELGSRSIPLPRVVLIDMVYPFDGRVLERDLGTIKAVEWHDTTETLSALRSLWLQKGTPSTKAADAKRHVVNWLRSWLPVGRAYRLRGDPLETERRTGTFAAGYQEYTRPGPQVSPDLFATLIDEKIAMLESEPSLKEFNRPALEAQMEFCLDRGVLPVITLPPSFGRTRELHALQESGVLPWMLAFDDPREVPEFWRLEDRQDTHHLRSGRPSEAFTRRLAAELYRTVLSGLPEGDTRGGISRRSS